METIKDALSKTQSSAEYSCGDEATELPTMLDLHIKNFGELSLLLSAHQAKELIKKCTQAPYGPISTK
jgi:hypothetical protein